MTKIKCLNCTGAVSTQKYTTPKGNVYEFHQGSFTFVKDPEDALHFLKSCNEEAFVAAEGPLSKIGKALESAAKKLLKKEEEVDEKEAPEETGVLEPSAEDLAAAEGETAPLDDEETEDAEPEGDADNEDQDLPNLEKMTKEELDVYAEEKHGIKLDRRKTKADMIADFHKEIGTQ